MSTDAEVEWEITVTKSKPIKLPEQVPQEQQPTKEPVNV